MVGEMTEGKARPSLAELITLDSFARRAYHPSKNYETFQDYDNSPRSNMGKTIGGVIEQGIGNGLLVAGTIAIALRMPGGSLIYGIGTVIEQAGYNKIHG